MAKYYRQQGETKRHKTLRFFRPVLVLASLIVLIGIGLFLYDIFRQDGESESSSASTKPVSSVVASSVQIQTTPYFQIQTPLKWRAIANESRNGHYVYRQFNGQLVEQDLTIDVNDSSRVVLATSRVNRVLPLVVESDGSIGVADNSLEHCSKSVKQSKTPQLVTMYGVTFPCTPDSPSYDVMAGLVGGSNIMTLTRPNGTKAVYKIYYRNVSANPSPRDLLSIIKTFETR